MPRKRLVRESKYPYHVTGRINNKDWFYIPLEYVWSVFALNSQDITENFGARVHAVVLMSNHFHMLLTTSGQDLGQVMNQFMREISRSINRSSGRINHVFGGPYKWSLIYGPLYYANALKYLYRNPTKAGVCHLVEEYPFSTLQQKLRCETEPFPLLPSVHEDWGILSLPTVAQLQWLNLKFEDKEDSCIRRALRRKVFEITPDPITRKVPKLFEQCE